MTLILTHTCHYAVLVAVEEGRDFASKPDNDLFVQCRLDLKFPPSMADLIPPSTLISTVPVTQDSEPRWRSTLAYFLSHNFLCRLRSQNATVRLDVCSLDSQGRHETVGSVTLELREARLVVQHEGKRELREVVRFVVDKGNWSPLTLAGGTNKDRDSISSNNGRSSRASNLSSGTSNTGGATPTTGRRRPEIKVGVFVVDMPRIAGEVNYDMNSLNTNIAVSTPPHTPLTARFERGLGARGGGLNVAPKDLGLAFSSGNVGDLFKGSSESQSSVDGEEEEEGRRERERDKEKGREREQRDKGKEREREQREKEKERERWRNEKEHERTIQLDNLPPPRTNAGRHQAPAPLLFSTQTDNRPLPYPTSFTIGSAVLQRTDSRSPPAQPRSPPSQSRSPPSQPRSPPSQSRSPPSQPRSPPSQPRSPPSQPRSPPAVSTISTASGASSAPGPSAFMAIPHTLPPNSNPSTYHQIGPGSSHFTFYFSVTHADHLSGLIGRGPRTQQPVYHFSYNFLGARISTSQARTLTRASFSSAGLGSRSAAAPEEQKTCFHLRGDLSDVRGWLDLQSKLPIHLVARIAPLNPPTQQSEPDDETIVGMAEIPLRGLYYGDEDDEEYHNGQSIAHLRPNTSVTVNASFEKVVTERGFPVYNIRRELSVSPRKEIARVGVRIGLVGGWWTEEEVVEAGLAQLNSRSKENAVRREIKFDDVLESGIARSARSDVLEGDLGRRRMFVGTESLSPKFPVMVGRKEAEAVSRRGSSNDEMVAERGAGLVNEMGVEADTIRYGRQGPLYDPATMLTASRPSLFISSPPSTLRDRSFRSADHQLAPATLAAPASVPAAAALHSSRSQVFTHGRSSSVPNPLKADVAQPVPGIATARDETFAQDSAVVRRTNRPAMRQSDVYLADPSSTATSNRNISRVSSPPILSSASASSPSRRVAGVVSRTRFDATGYHSDELDPRHRSYSHHNHRDHRDHPASDPDVESHHTETLALMYLEALSMVRDNERRWDRVHNYVNREVDEVVGEREGLRNMVEGATGETDGEEGRGRERVAGGPRRRRESLSEGAKGLGAMRREAEVNKRVAAGGWG